MERKIQGKRKTHHKGHAKKTHTRKRRISGVSMQKPLLLIGGLGGGAIAARELNTLAVKFFPSIASNPLISGLVQAGAGYFLVPKLIKGPWGQMLGYGMIANGVMVAVVSTGIISGRGSQTYHLGPAVNGVNLPMINGNSLHMKAVNGANSGTLPSVNGPVSVQNRRSGAGSIRPRSFRTVVP